MKWQFKFLLILISLNYTLNTNCDEINELPKSFEYLLPQYESIKLIHYHNFFFISENELQIDFKISFESSIK